MRKTISLSFALLISGALAGCTTTDGNANLRNANSNTGYVTTSPTPLATSTPVANTGNTGSMNSSSMNSNHMSNTNSTHNSNTTSNSAKTNSNKSNSNH